MSGEAFFSQLLEGLELPGFQGLRSAARDRLGARSLPGRKEEDWRYLDLSPLSAQTWFPGESCPVDLRCRVLQETLGTRLVFINGHFDPHHSVTALLPSGLRFAPFSQEPTEGLGDLHQGEDPFALLNAAAFRDGALLDIPDCQVVGNPLHVVFHNHSETPTHSHPRLRVRLGAGAEATLIEEYCGSGPNFVNAMTEIHLAPGARLRHLRIQREDEGAIHIASQYTELGARASYDALSVGFGAQLFRFSPRYRLMGRGAELRLEGLSLLHGRQTADTHSRIDHEVRDCSSLQVQKCIVDEASHGIFNGQIYVHPGADGTDAQQSSRNLLLSREGKVDTKPQLEIFADDVKCSHGATVGALDPEELFYLQSRGLSPEASRNLLTYAFAADLLKRVPVQSLRRQLMEAVLSRTSVAEAL